MKLVDYILAAAMLPQQAINTLHQGELINQVQRDRVAEITSVFVCKCTVRALYSATLSTDAHLTVTHSVQKIIIKYMHNNELQF